MQFMTSKGAVVTGAASETSTAFLQYPVMPTLRPAYPRGPWHYKNMHQLVVTYESTAEAVRAVVPPPLQPADGNRVTIEWRHMTEVSGFGPYTEVGHSVACTFEGKPAIYVFQAFLDSESPTLAGREILGFPKRHGEPELKTVREVLTGTLSYGGVQVALATMPYRAVDLRTAWPRSSRSCRPPSSCSSCFPTLTTTRRRSPSSSGSVSTMSG